MINSKYHEIDNQPWFVKPGAATPADAVEEGGSVGVPANGGVEDAPAASAEGGSGKSAADGSGGSGGEEQAKADDGGKVRKPAPSVAEGGTPMPGTTLSTEQIEQMTEDIIAALKTVHDPEIPSDIYELGLIYRIDISDEREVEVDMTLTAPGCPVAGEMPQWVDNAVRTVPGVMDVKVNLVFDPPWDMSRMSDEAKLAVGMF